MGSAVSDGALGYSVWGCGMASSNIDRSGTARQGEGKLVFLRSCIAEKRERNHNMYIV